MRRAIRSAAIAFVLVHCGNGHVDMPDVASGMDASPDVGVHLDAAPDASADAGPPYYTPPGYTLTPFLAPEAPIGFDRAEMVLDPTRHYEAVLETDVGRIVFDLFDTQTPITVNSFVFLARNHFFDGLAFHRVVAGFVAQGGDPNTLYPDRSAWGTGGPGYQFGLEIVPSLNFDTAGIVGMARGQQPDTNGSQFFITLAPAMFLDTHYTVFARVVDGVDVPAHMPLGMPPANPTRMQRVYIVEQPR